MGAKAKKLKWDDVEDIAFRLIDEHPRTDPKALSLKDVNGFVTKLRDFGDSPKKSNEGTLKLIQERWYDERMDMEDELGPVFTSESDEDEDLDEEHFRADRESLAVLGEEEEEDEEQDFDEGFQEEEL